MPFPPSFTNVWDITQPPDTQLANLLGQDLRTFRNDIMQRFSLLSGLLANRPTPETVNATWGGVGFGILYFATDVSKVFQWSGSPVAWVDVTASLIPVTESVVATVNLATQQANIGSTLLYNVPVSGGGQYRASGFIEVTQAATTSATLPQLELQWTDFDLNVSESGALLISPSGNNNIVTTYGVTQGANGFSGTFYAKASTTINYFTLFYASVGATPMQYSLHLKLEYLGL